MADRAVRANSIVFDPPRLDLAPRVVEAQEPKCVQAFLADAAVEALGEGVVGRLAGARVVQHHAVLPSPQIEIARHKFGPVVDPDALRPAMLAGGSFQRGDDIVTPVGVCHADRRTELGADVDDGQDAQLAAVKQLVGHEVHRPALVWCGCHDAILPQLGGHLPFRIFVAQLKTFLAIEPARALVVDRPALTPQENMNAPISVAHARLGNLANALAQRSLVGTAGPIVIGRAIQRIRPARPPNADPIAIAQMVDDSSGPARLHI